MIILVIEEPAHVIDWENFHGERRHLALRQQRKQEAQDNAHQDQRHYYQVDHLGTPLELFDTDGITVWSAKYKAWGAVWEFGAETVRQPLRFQGQYFDDESGFHYNKNRYYDPETARFITQDPIGLSGGTNLYRYAPNGIAWIDPVGLAKRGQLGSYNELAKGKANTGDLLEAHELVRNEALEQMGCGAKTKNGNPKRHPDNPSISLDLPTHDDAHRHENALAQRHLGVGVNQFQFGANGRPTKQQMDVWQGALRKSGIGAAQSRRLRKMSNRFLKNLCCCP